MQGLKKWNISHSKLQEILPYRKSQTIEYWLPLKKVPEFGI